MIIYHDPEELPAAEYSPGQCWFWVETSEGPFTILHTYCVDDPYCDPVQARLSAEQISVWCLFNSRGEAIPRNDRWGHLYPQIPGHWTRETLPDHYKRGWGGQYGDNPRQSFERLLENLSKSGKAYVDSVTRREPAT